MDAWLSYGLSDFLLFSPQTYFRQFALINEAMFPLPLLLQALAAALLLLTGNGARWRGRAVAIGLCLLWASSGWLFHWRSYAAINWAAAWFALGFAAQSALLLWLGVAADGMTATARSTTAALPARAVAAIIVLVYPLLALAFGRPWQEAELIGVSPDATAAFSAATIALCAPRGRWLMLALPLSWCAIALATLHVMGAPEFWVMTACVAGVVATLIADRRAHRARRTVPDREG